MAGAAKNFRDSKTQSRVAEEVRLLHRQKPKLEIPRAPPAGAATAIAAHAADGQPDVCLGQGRV